MRRYTASVSNVRLVEEKTICLYYMRELCLLFCFNYINVEIKFDSISSADVGMSCTNKYCD